MVVLVDIIVSNIVRLFFKKKLFSEKNAFKVCQGHFLKQEEILFHI